MSSEVAYVSKTQHYLRVKKPLLERQRRARINKCLDALKNLVADLQGDDAILRMDKAEMLESTISFMRTCTVQPSIESSSPFAAMDGFRNGYMNAVNEVSRVMAGTPGMSVQVGKTVMTHLGLEFNRILQQSLQSAHETQFASPQTECTRVMSPASSGYHSDCDDSPLPSPAGESIWRPW